MTKKTGTTSNTLATDVARWSRSEPRRTAAKSPSRIPTGTAHAEARKISSAVTGNPSSTASSTDWLRLTRLGPKSSVATLRT